MKKTFYFFRRPSRLGSHGLTALLTVVLGGAPLLADSASSSTATGALGASADLAWLTQEARQWVAGQEGLRAESIAFQPLDKRITATPCAEPLVIDKPFGGTQTLRVRCLSSSWQVFLQRTDGGKPRAGRDSEPASAPGNGLVAQIQHGKATVRSESVGTRGEPVARIGGRTGQPSATPTPEPSQLVVVAKQNLIAGQALEPGAFALEKRAIEGSPSQYFLQPDGLEFSELMRDVKAGDPIRQRDLKKALLVKRNHLVQYTVSGAPGLQITVQLQSMDDGRIGDQIRLKNLESGKILSGMVVGRNLARSL